MHSAHQGRVQIDLSARAGLVGFSSSPTGSRSNRLSVFNATRQHGRSRGQRSVFAGQHHDHDPLRDGRISRVRRVIDEVLVVVIDLEHYFDAIYREDRAVVLAIRIIVTGECIESRDCSEDTRDGSDAQGLNSRRDHDPATPPKAAELIIQGAYAS